MDNIKKIGHKEQIVSFEKLILPSTFLCRVINIPVINLSATCNEYILGKTKRKFLRKLIT